MSTAQIHADAALRRVVSDLTALGLVAAWRDLFRTVWETNVARHEPDELGDTPMTLGVQTHQNFIVRAGRRWLGDPIEAEEDHWSIDGLTVVRKGNHFVMNVAGVHVSTMKVPHLQGRDLRPELLPQWQSAHRKDMGQRNSAALGHYNSAAGDLSLFDEADEFGVIRDFLLILAGEPGSNLTSAWVGVPVSGDEPLIAVQRLWWDEPDAKRVHVPGASGGPSFDQGEAPAPRVTLKPRAHEEGHA